MNRHTSDSRLTSLQSETNANVSWLGGSFVWTAYVAIIAIVRLLVFYFLSPLLSLEWQWTLTSVVHGVITFVGFHWTRGSPFWADQGEHIEQTLWEQIDNGVPWTDTRKFLMVVPILLFLVVSHYTGYVKEHLAINAIVLGVLMLSKLPEMHGVRIFRINKGTVPDNE